MKKPGLLLTISSLAILIVLLSATVIIFGEDATSGPVQIALLLTMSVIAFISLIHLKVPWEKIEKAIGENLHQTGPTILILLAIGALTGSWMLSGIVPTMIYYGLEIISPKFFIAITFVLCCLVSTLAGSSWTTVGTIGLAMLTAGNMVGMPVGWMAGAIISGAYLGDKLSPLSDTVNLAATMAGTDLYTHVKYSLYTAIPAFIICFTVFLVVGFTVPVTSSLDMAAQMNAIHGVFNISPWLLLIPCITFYMVVKKVPAFLTLFVSAFVAAAVAFFVQPEIISQICGEASGFKAFVISTMKIMSVPIGISTGDPLIDNLASTRGMAGMVNTVWLVICIMAVGGILAASGMLALLTEKLTSIIKGQTSLVTSTIGTCIVSNMILSDQYMSILIPGKMFSETYRKMGFAPELLSRTLGDSGTVSSVLVPWNTCAVVQSTVLGIATLEYLPYSIFCFVTPLIAISLAAFNIDIRKIKKQTQYES